MKKLDIQKKFLSDMLHWSEFTKLRIAPWQNKVLVHDPDVYHKIAYMTGTNTVELYNGRIYFKHDNLGLKNSAHTWSYELTERANDFLERYGVLYRQKYIG